MLVAIPLSHRSVAKTFTRDMPSVTVKISNTRSEGFSHTGYHAHLRKEQELEVFAEGDQCWVTSSLNQHTST